MICEVSKKKICKIENQNFNCVTKELNYSIKRGWTFRRGMLSHSCVIWDSRCSVVLGLLCQIFHFVATNVFDW